MDKQFLAGSYPDWAESRTFLNDAISPASFRWPPWHLGRSHTRHYRYTDQTDLIEPADEIPSSQLLSRKDRRMPPSKLNHSLSRFPWRGALPHFKNSWKYSTEVLRLTEARMNVDEVAYKIRPIWITQDTIILVYGTSRFDLTLLRQFLESGGHFNLLPPDEDCIPMVKVRKVQSNTTRCSGSRSNQPSFTTR